MTYLEEEDENDEMRDANMSVIIPEPMLCVVCIVTEANVLLYTEGKSTAASTNTVR